MTKYTKEQQKLAENHAVTKYAHKVLDTDYGKMCGKYEKAACKRHLDDLKKSYSADYPYCFDTTRADRIIRHFEAMPRVDVEHELIELEDWQKFDYGCALGWVRKTDGKRRFKRCYIRIARGHAKTVGAAAIGNYFMCGDAIYPPYHPEKAKYEMSPEINIIAVDRDQGNRIREDISSMALRCPAIAKRLIIKKSYITNRTRGGKVVVFSKDKNNKDGGRPSLVITEEWHAHKDGSIHEVGVSGMGKKWQCLEFIITTAGTDAENKPCYADDRQYKMVLDGDIAQDDVFIMIRETDDGDDPHDIASWDKANAFFRDKGPDGLPAKSYARNLYDEVKSAHDDAYAANNYAKILEFLIKRTDRWQTDSPNKYFTGCMDKLRELMVPHDEFIELTKNVSGHYGFDLGKTRDLSGTAYATKIKDGRVAVSVHGFLPEEKAVEHEHSDRIPYTLWADDGYVTLTPGEVTDSRVVEKSIYDCESDYGWKAEEIDYDGHNATDMAIRMGEHYGNPDMIVEIAQTCAGQNLATKRFREMVLADEPQIVCEYSPLLVWCLSNAIEIQNNYGDIKLNKKHKDDTQRIDPVAAMMNALARLLVKIDNGIDVGAVVKKRGHAIW